MAAAFSPDISTPLSTGKVRAASLLLAAALVAALLWAGLFARYRLQLPDLSAAHGVEALLITIEDGARAPPQRAEAAQHAARASRAPGSSASGATAPVQAPQAEAPTGASFAGLDAYERCATATARRDHPEHCAGYDRGGAGGAIALRAPQETVTRGLALRRAIGNSVSASAESYALGEAQKYADPRDDPLFEKGTDPATAAMRPCAAGETPQGTGAHLTGRTCQPMR